MRKIVLAIVLLLTSIPSIAQAPRYPGTFSRFTNQSLGQIKSWIDNTEFTRVVTVDKTLGVGDFQTIKEACDYVSAQVRSSTAKWLIKVYPGTYAESPFTIPTHTVVDGAYNAVANPFGNQITVTSSITSGTFITLSGSLNGINIEHSGTLTGNVILINVTSGAPATISHSSVISFSTTATFSLTEINVDNLVGTNSVWVYYCYFAVVSGGTNAILYNQDGGGTSYIIDSIFSSQGTPLAGVKISAGTLSIVRSKIGSPYQSAQFVQGIHQTGGNVYVNDTEYHTATGTINDSYHRPKTRRITDTLPATCEITDNVVDIGTVKRFCVCVADDTWNCSTLTAP